MKIPMRNDWPRTAEGTCHSMRLKSRRSRRRGREEGFCIGDIMAAIFHSHSGPRVKTMTIPRKWCTCVLGISKDGTVDQNTNLFPHHFGLLLNGVLVTFLFFRFISHILRP